MSPVASPALEWAYGRTADVESPHNFCATPGKGGIDHTDIQTKIDMHTVNSASHVSEHAGGYHCVGHSVNPDPCGMRELPWARPGHITDIVAVQTDRERL